tara:strand:- start:14263 stop:15339 length:1077 start_codon:yes stop_codon:yes gene_type:complete
MKKVALITNIPAPYRESTYEEISKNPDIDFNVIYSKKIESNRSWKFELGKYKRTFLNSFTIPLSQYEIHLNLSIYKRLNELNPDILILTGFNPVMLIAFFWARKKSKRIIIFSDGTLDSEKGISFIQRSIRKLFYKHANSFIAASQKTVNLHRHYGASDEDIFISCLCIDNDRLQTNCTEKTYDLMFSGQLINRKQPLFFIEVAEKYLKLNGKCKALILGDGKLNDEVSSRIKNSKVDFHFPGFVQQDDLVDYYSKAHIFLFPSLSDPWGIVVNEAVAAGLPVISSKHPGSVGELIVNKKNSFVLDLDSNIWAEKAFELISDNEKYNRFKDYGLNLIKNFNKEKASNGIIEAIKNAYE